MAEVIAPADLEEAMGGLVGWEAVTPEGAPSDARVLDKVLEFDDFTTAMAFVNAVADIAEEMDHHPEIAIAYDRVGLQIWSHAAGGITERCLELASRIDDLLE